jgi:lambda family phage portal protein
MTPNWLDKAFAFVAPAVALRRIRSRAALEVAFSYDSADTGRTTHGWTTGSASANAEISAGAAISRDRASSLVRNNPYAKNAVRQFSTKLVGTGIMPRSATGNAALDKRVNDLYLQFDAQGNADGRSTLSACQQIWAAAIFERGDVFVRRRSRRMSDPQAIKFQVQTLEADYLDTSQQLAASGGNTIDGIVFDSIGRRTGYWLWQQHPGERAIVRSAFRSALVPASEVGHGYLCDRPGQIRGITAFAPVVTKLKNLDDLAEAKLYARKIEACFAAFVTQQESESSPRLGAVTTADGQRVESFEPGMIQYLRPDEDIKFAEPKAAPGYTDEAKLWLHGVATGLGIPYELLTGDLTQVNYSSYRGSLLAFKDLIESVRWNTFIPNLLEPIWGWFIDSAIQQGLLPDGRYPVEWDCPAFDLLDRLEEAKADMAELRIGGSTWPQMVARRGYDPSKQVAEIQYWNQVLDAAGVILDGDPRQRTSQGNIPSGGGQQNEANSTA